MKGQLLLNVILVSAHISLVATSFSLVISHNFRLYHFAHGGVYVVGAYIAYALIEIVHVSSWLSIPTAVLGAALLGGLIDIGIYRPLRKRGSPTLVLLIASLGLFIVLQNGVALLFGDQSQTLQSSDVQAGLPIFGARITVAQIVLIVSSAVLCTATWVALQFTRWGKMVRAVASDPELAEIVGIDRDRVILLTFAAGSALAAVAAILTAYEGNITPTMGFRTLLLAITAVIIGGVGRISGAVLGGVIVGAVLQLSVWKLPIQWQDAIVFLLLILFLLLRPQGLVGRPPQKATL